MRTLAGPAPTRASVEVRVTARPPCAYALPRRTGRDGLMRRRGRVLERLLHRDGERVLVRVAQTAHDTVLFGATAPTREAAEWGIAAMRRALGVDHDLREFHRRFARDPLIGRLVHADPALRILGRPTGFEALAFAICEQLIEYERAVAIERRIVAQLGHRCERTGLRDAPGAAVLAAQAPALLASLDLSAGRAATLVAAAREVARGRVDLDSCDPLVHEAGWRRLRALRGIGSWTVQMLGLTGQGRLDQLPAGDVSYLKLVGRLLYGDPYARATEAEVERYFAPYHPWSGLAGAYALRLGVGAAVRTGGDGSSRGG